VIPSLHTAHVLSALAVVLPIIRRFTKNQITLTQATYCGHPTMCRYDEYCLEANVEYRVLFSISFKIVTFLYL